MPTHDPGEATSRLPSSCAATAGRPRRAGPAAAFGRPAVRRRARPRTQRREPSRASGRKRARLSECRVTAGDWRGIEADANQAQTSRCALRPCCGSSCPRPLRRRAPCSSVSSTTRSTFDPEQNNFPLLEPLHVQVLRMTLTLGRAGRRREQAPADPDRPEPIRPTSGAATTRRSSARTTRGSRCC